MAFTWDHRFQALNVSFRYGLGSNDILAATLSMQRLMDTLDVRPEELRALAEELEKKANIEDLTMHELCRKAIDQIDVKGKSVLDIGGYDGAMAKYCLDRGAASATVLDSGQWHHHGWEEPVMPDGVEYDIADFRASAASADVVLFFNVLYHVEHPHAALRKLLTITGETMLLCTMYVYSDLPVWRVYEPREVNPTDETVYWAPSAAGLFKSLKVMGWSEVTEIGRAAERMVVKCQP